MIWPAINLGVQLSLHDCASGTAAVLDNLITATPTESQVHDYYFAAPDVPLVFAFPPNQA